MFLFGLGVLVLLAISGAARAQDGPGGRLQLPTREAPGCGELEQAAQGAPEPTRLEHDGTAGMWFPMATARLVLCEVRELRIRRRELALVDQELALWDRQATNYQTQAELAVEARDALMETMEAAERRAREAEERLDAWYRHPALWFTVGAVVTGVVFFGAVAALGAI